MPSSLINSLRALKRLYDLAFSEDQFYVESRAEFLGGIRHSIHHAKAGYRDPPLQRELVRMPFKVLLILLVVVFLLTALIGRH